MRWSFVLLSLAALATPAAAQSVYVGAGVVGDVARFGKVDFNSDVPRLTGDGANADGEALGFSLRVGRALGRNWGVEFEFARSGEIENEARYSLPPMLVRPVPPILPIPVDFEYEVSTEQQHLSFATLAWVRHDVGDRVDLSYLGGLVFNRSEFEQRVRITDTRLAQWISIAPDINATEHRIAPAVGIEAAVEVSESAAITGGVRVHGVSLGGRSGWLIRPMAGFRVSF